MIIRYTLPLSLFACLYLGGCAFAPGMHMADNLTLTPTRTGAVIQPQITTINAELILQQQRKAEIATELALRNYTPPQGFYTNASQYAYQVGPGDVLSIIVYDHPNLSSSGIATSYTDQTTNAQSQISSASSGSGNSVSAPSGSGFVVDSRGNIYYPYVGSVNVAGKTMEQVRSLLTEKMASFIVNPQLNVQIMQYASQGVTVTGAVMKPIEIVMTNTPLTVLDAAGAANPISCATQQTTQIQAPLCADLHHVQVSQNGVTTLVDLDTLQSIAGTSTNWILQNGAHVYIPTNERQRVFVLGAVNQPGPIPMIEENMSLKEALGDAMGPTMLANSSYTYVIRNYDETPQVFLLDAGSPDALNLAGDFTLKPQDVIYVSTAKIQNFNAVLQQVLPALTTIAVVKSITQ